MLSVLSRAATAARRGCATAALAVAFGCVLLMDVTSAERLLIDDFTLDQVGISTDQFAAYDTVDFDNPVGEYRQVWGGGASVDGNCEDTEMSAFISEGAMSVMVGPDCYGGGCVRWFGNETLDITEYDSVVLTVSELVGSIDIRISIATNLLGAQRLDATLSSTGDFSFEIEDFIQYGNVDLTEVGMLNVCLSVEQGEFVALDSVHLAIPEPRSIVLIALVLIGVFGWRNSGRVAPVSRLTYRLNKATRAVDRRHALLLSFHACAGSAHFRATAAHWLVRI